MSDKGADVLIAKDGPISVRAEGATQLHSDYPPVELGSGWRFGRYELLGRLAYGGMAEIYLARESACGLAVRYVVIKRVLPHIATDSEFVAMFMDEARLAMSLSHPNISHIYEFGRIEGSYFLAMEWVNGVALHRIIKRCITIGTPFPRKFVVNIIGSVAEALHYAHAAKDEEGHPLGVVHRDVTPHNIMLSFDGSVKLLDFGIAMADRRTTDTRTGLVRGKIAYMSPQQCVAKAVDGRSDIFSLGVCMYEALLGRRLYKRPTDYETCQSILQDPVPGPRDVQPDLPEGLDQIVRRCLAKDPQDRYATAGELQTALAGYLAERGEVASSAQMAEMLRELFPLEQRRGPRLETNTDLLHGLPRESIEESKRSGADLFPSSRPTQKRDALPPKGSPAEAEVQSRDVPREALKPEPEVLPRREATEVTSSRTRAVMPASGSGMAYAVLLSSLLAVALAAFALWTLMNRPSGSPAATQRQGLPELRETPRVDEPAVLEIPGTELSAEGSEADKEVAPGEEMVAEVDPLRGSIWVSSEPPGAELSVNGQSTEQETPSQVDGVWPGMYRLTLRKDGYVTYRTRVSVEAGKVTQHAAHLRTEEEARELYRARSRAEHEGTAEGASEGSDQPVDEPQVEPEQDEESADIEEIFEN